MYGFEILINLFFFCIATLDLDADNSLRKFSVKKIFDQHLPVLINFRPGDVYFPFSGSVIFLFGNGPQFFKSNF
jgi:hypothetical protein